MYRTIEIFDLFKKLINKKKGGQNVVIGLKKDSGGDAGRAVWSVGDMAATHRLKKPTFLFYIWELTTLTFISGSYFSQVAFS